MPDSNEKPVTGDRASDPGRRISKGAKIVTGATVIGAVFAGLALSRDYFGWQAPQPLSTAIPTGAAAAPPGGPGSTPAGAGPSAGGTSGPPAADTRKRLDTLPVESGAGNVRQLPRELVGKPEYERSVVIDCPSNAGADLQSEVTYLLQGDYLDFSATVDPWFALADHRNSEVDVSVLVAIPQRDGTEDKPTRGRQSAARMGEPKQLTASVADADTLTLRVKCEWPGGLVILTNARLTRG